VSESIPAKTANNREKFDNSHDRNGLQALRAATTGVWGGFRLCQQTFDSAMHDDSQNPYFTYS